MDMHTSVRATVKKAGHNLRLRGRGWAWAWAWASGCFSTTWTGMSRGPNRKSFVLSNSS